MAQLCRRWDCWLSTLGGKHISRYIIRDKKNLEFTISVEQVPEIKKLEIEKISLTKYEVKSDKKEIDERIKYIAEGNKKYIDFNGT